MSVASVSGYLFAIEEKIYGIGDTIFIPLVQSGTPINSNSVFTFCPLTDPIPKGRWLVSGTVGITVTDEDNAVVETIDVILYKDGINPLTDIYSALTSANSYTANQTIPAIIFISDGTDKITGQVSCLVSSSGGDLTWNVDPNSPQCFLEMIRISNEGYV